MKKLHTQSMPTVDISSHINVRGQMPPLASGVSPAREADSAEEMPEVSEGRGFAPSVCSDCRL